MNTMAARLVDIREQLIYAECDPEMLDTAGLLIELDRLISELREVEE